jgi:hypothetical protein
MTHRLSDDQWHRFFVLCAKVLEPGDPWLAKSKSYCVFTTFDRLKTDVHYWQCGLPLEKEINDTWIADGGVWGQPFSFQNLAHIVIPRTWGFEHPDQDGMPAAYEERTQHIETLSRSLKGEGIDHRLTNLVLEIKCY